jgi:hypothetical protein
MFYPGSGSEQFSIHPNPNIIIPDPGSYTKRVMKNNNYRYLFSCSLLFQEHVLIVKKIIHFGSESGKIYPGSGYWIQGVKKHRIPDPDRNTGSGYAVLIFGIRAETRS